ncbi:hypothetical protein QP166_15045 [Sphingomonas sp. LR60]|jgi:hypothetical protein|uniref:hypothetical protein n=1 Tax=Sphingomonas sp. LR60 TaxID=3050233 RepID=UPI002FDFF44F
MNTQQRDGVFFASHDAATIQMLASYIADQASAENDDRLCAAMNGLTSLARQLSEKLLALSREGKDA